MTDIRKAVRDLKPGDLVDIEADKFADPPAARDPFWEYEYAVVDEIYPEGPECIVVHFADGPSVGFPPDHEVPVSVGA